EVHRLVIGRNPGTHVALVGDQTCCLELPDGLTYWNDADLQCIGDGREHQTVSGFIFVGADLFPNPCISLIRLGATSRLCWHSTSQHSQLGSAPGWTRGTPGRPPCSCPLVGKAHPGFRPRPRELLPTHPRVPSSRLHPQPLLRYPVG